MASENPNFDAVVIGAGFSGMYMLKSLRDKLGLNVRVYEAGETVGGTWYWNRYPGACCDSDSYIYCFTWDKQPAPRGCGRHCWSRRIRAPSSEPSPLLRVGAQLSLWPAIVMRCSRRRSPW